MSDDEEVFCDFVESIRAPGALKISTSYDPHLQHIWVFGNHSPSLSLDDPNAFCFSFYARLGRDVIGVQDYKRGLVRLEQTCRAIIAQHAMEIPGEALASAMSGLRLCGGIDIQIPDHDFFPALTGGCGRYGLDPIDLLK